MATVVNVDPAFLPPMANYHLNLHSAHASFCTLKPARRSPREFLFYVFQRCPTDPPCIPSFSCKHVFTSILPCSNATCPSPITNALSHPKHHHTPPALYPPSYKHHRAPFYVYHTTNPACRFRPGFSTEDANKYLAMASAGAFIVRNAPKPPKGSKGPKPSKYDMCLTVQTGERICNVLLKNRVDTSDQKAWYLFDAKNWYEDLTDVVLHAQEKPFTFPKLKTPDVLLSMKASKAAEKEYKKLKKAEWKKMSKGEREVAKMNGSFGH